MPKSFVIVVTLFALIVPAAVLAEDQVPVCFLTDKSFLPGTFGSDAGPATALKRGQAAPGQADYNGDGCEDLAIAAPRSQRGVRQAGWIEIYYGSPDGLPNSHSEKLTVATGGVISLYFGWSVAAGDFNNDGYTDLAASEIGRQIGGDAEAGSVYIFYGAPDGLKNSGRVDEWHQDSPGVPGGAEPHDHFGETLAVGDFNGDRFSDLAIGTPQEAIGSEAAAGYVIVLYGSSDGLTAGGAQGWSQNSSGVPGLAEPNDQFGFALAAANFGKSGEDDLAIGTPFEDFESRFATDAGAVYLLYGSPQGLTAGDANSISQETSGVEGIPQDDDRFGYALAAGDFDGDGMFDLAAGAPHESIFFQDESGWVGVFYGQSGKVLSGEDSDAWYQGKGDVAGDNESGDHFGHALVAADFDRDHRWDLAVGRPGEEVGSIQNAGAIGVLYGTSSGLSDNGAQGWTLNSSGVPGSSAENDRLGTALTAGDYNGDGYWELVGGMPGKNGTGGALLLRGSSGNLTSAGSREIVPSKDPSYLTTVWFGAAMR